MKKTIISLAVIGLISTIFATTMIIHTIDGEETSYEISNIESITFNNPNPEIPTDYVAYYPFNGNVEDISSNEYNGSLVGNATVENNYLEIGNNSIDALSLPISVLNGLGDFTFSSAVRINDFHDSGYSPTNTIICGALPYPSDNGFVVDYSINEGRWRFILLSENQVFFEENSIIEDNQWHHIALTRENNLVRFYFDGVLIGTPIEFSENAIEISDSSLFMGQDQDNIGGSGFSTNQSLAGCLDNTVIYDRALNDNEINQLYNFCAITN